MNYRHAYHAGNFADVFKHVVLILVIESLFGKEKPFCYLDTHAGIGKYNLKSVEAQKTKEFEVGIAELMIHSGKKPTVIEHYLQIVKDMNKNSNLKFYPGSPRIARSLLRSNDKMILSELHEEDYKFLKEEFKHDKQVGVHHLNGYQALKAFLPPKQGRGVVLIDPPYEVKNEFDLLLKSLTLALHHFAQGIFLIWYPVKNRHQITTFENKLKNKGVKELLMCELNLYPDDAPLGLNGSGMAIINPPWQLEEKLYQILPWLLNVLDKSGKGNYRIQNM